MGERIKISFKDVAFEVPMDHPDTNPLGCWVELKAQNFEVISWR